MKNYINELNEQLLKLKNKWIIHVNVGKDMYQNNKQEEIN